MWCWLEKSHICVARTVFSVQHDDSIRDITSFIPPHHHHHQKNKTVSFKPSHSSPISSMFPRMLDLSCSRCCGCYYPAVGFRRKHWGCSEWLSEWFSEQFLQKILHFVRHFPCLFMISQSGRLISLEDAAAFALVYLSLCFQPHIKMPGSAGYHGASSLLSAHFNPADFSSWIFISALLPPFSLQSLSLFQSLSLSLSLCPPILISFQRADKSLLNNVTHGPPILYQFFLLLLLQSQREGPLGRESSIWTWLSHWITKCTSTLEWSQWRWVGAIGQMNVKDVLWDGGGNQRIVCHID